ncbi:hypothetical protein BDV93DRAFT_567094 [Ceratobasidium sp. AG-I]|nr:hypothetical protein BDV93DRAFT_567094 [Ceratobasidium sp. AG-I]
MSSHTSSDYTRSEPYAQPRLVRPLHSPPPPPPSLPRPDALEVCESTHQINAPDTLANYYRLIFALFRGDNHRPPLPFELVIYIARLSELASPYPSKLLSSLLTWKPSPPRIFIGVLYPSRLIHLIKTPPLPQDALRTICKIEVTVNFVESTRFKVRTLLVKCSIGRMYIKPTYTQRAGYWNQFHIDISTRAKASEDNTTPEPDERLTWPCFEPVPSEESRQDNQPSEKFERIRHSVIGCDHEIWQHVVPGDCIEVSVMTQPIDTPNDYCEAVIRVYKAWEPSLEMLKFSPMFYTKCKT